MSQPTVTHFYSYATGVSLELPAGFEFAGEDDASAHYADLPLTGEPTAETPQVRIRAVSTLEPGAGEQTIQELADAFAAESGELISRRDTDVDDEPATTVVLRRASDGLMLHMTATRSPDRLVTVIASAPGDGMVAAFDSAVASIRFIEL